MKTWANGDRYEGAFADDRREGFGTYTWGRGKWAGERYEGGYSNDQRHGYGTFREYLAARTSTPTTDVHLTLARKEYEDAQAAWERLQSEMEAAEPTMVIDLTGETPRPIG